MTTEEKIKIANDYLATFTELSWNDIAKEQMDFEALQECRDEREIKELCDFLFAPYVAEEYEDDVDADDNCNNDEDASDDNEYDNYDRFYDSPFV